jgi:hypothetical protein
LLLQDVRTKYRQPIGDEAGVTAAASVLLSDLEASLPLQLLLLAYEVLASSTEG